jgi:hypothetical protein
MNDYPRRSDNSLNPFVAGITGVVIGAGLAIAGAMALKNEKNKKKIKGILDKLEDKTDNMVQDVKNTANQTKTQAENRMDEEM